MTKIGIISYEVYVPHGRVKVLDLAKENGMDPKSVLALGIETRSVNESHEDTITMAVESCIKAFDRVDKKTIGALFFGSETHPYAVKPSATVVSGLLDLPEELACADIEFACKGGTAAMQIVYNYVKAGSIEAGVAIGSDVGKGSPSDILFYSASSGAATFVIGKSDNVIAEIIDTISITSDTPDFWRAEGEEFPSHTGRFSAHSYETHIMTTVQKILLRNNLTPSEFAHVVLHMPNGKIPKTVAKKIGFTEKQLNAGFIVKEIGNTYSAQTLIGLASALDSAKKDDLILVCSYGSGAGSDAFIIKKL